MSLSISAIAALALSVGPSAIRGLSSLFGESKTAEQLAGIVEAAESAFPPEREFARLDYVHEKLSMLSPDQLIELEKIQLQLEQEVTRRQELSLQDKQAAHEQTQKTIREGDKALDEKIRRLRPAQSWISFWAGYLYALIAEIALSQGIGSGTDIFLLLTLWSYAFAYFGLRTIDGFAPYPKSSGDKATGALKEVATGVATGVIGSLIKGRLKKS